MPAHWHWQLAHKGPHFHPAAGHKGPHFHPAAGHKGPHFHPAAGHKGPHFHPPAHGPGWVPPHAPGHHHHCAPGLHGFHQVPPAPVCPGGHHPLHPPAQPSAWCQQAQQHSPAGAHPDSHPKPNAPPQRPPPASAANRKRLTYLKRLKKRELWRKRNRDLRSAAANEQSVEFWKKLPDADKVNLLRTYDVWQGSYARDGQADNCYLFISDHESESEHVSETETDTESESESETDDTESEDGIEEMTQ